MSNPTKKQILLLLKPPMFSRYPTSSSPHHCWKLSGPCRVFRREGNVRVKEPQTFVSCLPQLFEDAVCEKVNYREDQHWVSWLLTLFFFLNGTCTVWPIFFPPEQGLLHMLCKWKFTSKLVAILQTWFHLRKSSIPSHFPSGKKSM